MSDIEDTNTPIEAVAAVAPKRTRKAVVEVAAVAPKRTRKAVVEVAAVAPKRTRKAVVEVAVEAAPAEDLGELRDFGTVQFYIKG